MSTFYDALLGLSGDLLSAQKLSAPLFGRVVSEEPLRVELERTRLVLEPEFLTVAQHLTDYEIPYEILSLEKATHRDKLPTELTNIRTVNGLYVEHDGKHYVEPDPPGELKRFDGQGTIKLLNHLMVDDRVILQRMEGGNMYLVIDRLPEEVA